MKHSCPASQSPRRILALSRRTSRIHPRGYNTPMPATETHESNRIAFPELLAADLDALRTLAIPCFFDDGDIVFRAGDAELDLFVVESGAIEILNPADFNRHVVTH